MQFFEQNFLKIERLHNLVTAVTEKSIQYRTYKFMYRIFVYLSYMYRYIPEFGFCFIFVYVLLIILVYVLCILV